VKDVSCTDAWLRLTAENLPPSTGFQLLRGDSVVQQGEMSTSDTLLYNEGLLPNHDYTYRAFLINDGRRIAQSAGQNVTTMDTTSQVFTWQTMAFSSPYGSASLYDVAIINENDIWAVGEIYSDSAQPSLPYNAVHWDGQHWELMRIPFVYQGSDFWGPIYTIIAFNENDVWFGIGSVIHWDGQRFISIKIPDDVFPSRANKMWGLSSDNLFIVGNNGSIAHYNGNDWQKLESGTELRVQDIWGAIDPKTGANFILCPAAYKYQASDEKLLSINPDQSVSEIPMPDPSPLANLYPHTVWFKDSGKLYLGGEGIYVRNFDQSWQKLEMFGSYYFNRIRGNDINDVFAVDDFGRIVHFNGLGWRQYASPKVVLLRSVDGREDLIVACGDDGRNAYIITGRRQ